MMLSDLIDHATKELSMHGDMPVVGWLVADGATPLAMLSVSGVYRGTDKDGGRIAVVQLTEKHRQKHGHGMCYE